MNYTELMTKKEVELFVYSPYNFIFDIEKRTIAKVTFIEPLLHEIKEGSCKVKEIIENGYSHYFFYKNLLWDSNYFNFSVNRIELVLFYHEDVFILSKAIKRFLFNEVKRGEYYFINVPCEDTKLIQALSVSGFLLIETRLNYYLDNIQNLKEKRHNVRKARAEDIPILRRIAENNRNPFDRIHADPAFTLEEADMYLGTFIEESVKGFADIVIVPDIPSAEPFGFLASNKPKEVLGKRIAKLVLAAVGNSENKGWLYNLLTETIYEMMKYSTDYLTTITQASNHPAIRTWEKAGFKLGFTTHIFSYRNFS